MLMHWTGDSLRHRNAPDAPGENKIQFFIEWHIDLDGILTVVKHS